MTFDPEKLKQAMARINELVTIAQSDQMMLESHMTQMDAHGLVGRLAEAEECRAKAIDLFESMMDNRVERIRLVRDFQRSQ